MIDTVIMAHPARTEQALRLAGQLNARITWDRGEGEWDTASRAWASINPASDRGLVLQDDALPLPNLLDHVRAGIPYAPRTCVSLYVGTGRPHADRVSTACARATATNSSWLTHSMLMWGVAIVLPTEHITPMLRWAQQDTRPYDHRIGAWYRTVHHLPIRYTWPSLVDHDDRQPSLLNHDRDRACVRRAHRVDIPDWNHDVQPIR